MTRAERHWWAVLVRACSQQTIEVQRDHDAMMDAWYAECAARRELVNLGVNLDELKDVDETFYRLRDEAKAKRREEQLVSDELRRRAEESAALIRRLG